MKRPQNLHKRFNNFLTVVVLVCAIYLVAAPFFPNAQYYVKRAVAQQPVLTVSQDKPGPVTSTPRLAISRLDFDEEIHQGTSLNVLDKGLWRRPNTSTPDKGGNTVIVGHRFYKSRPAIFYHLDKVKVGDAITIDWDSARYYYEVTKVLVVNPDAAYIEGETDQPLLTLYTCTPLWSSAQRLVVQAKLVRTTP